MLRVQSGAQFSIGGTPVPEVIHAWLSIQRSRHCRCFCLCTSRPPRFVLSSNTCAVSSLNYDAISQLLRELVFANSRWSLCSQLASAQDLRLWAPAFTLTGAWRCVRPSENH